MVVVFAYSTVFADCEAPALVFKKHEGIFLGFKVTKIWGNDEIDSVISPNETIINFGDYQFLISPKNTSIEPAELSINTSEISKKLLKNLKSSEHYLRDEKQVFTVSDIKVYDLTADLKVNLIFFNVSSAGGTYSGAVGIVNRDWLELVEPTCY
jgi:hypothetical protein